VATATVPAPLGERLTRIWETAPGLYGVLATVDHKVIGRRYLATAMVVVIALLALATAIRSWGGIRHGHEAEHRQLAEVREERARFMAYAGILLSVVFLFATLMNTVPLITNSLCMY
jgi:heme/copper-type cytochrome/quinol oxidase subunit 1